MYDYNSGIIHIRSYGDTSVIHGTVGVHGGSRKYKILIPVGGVVYYE